MALGSSMPCPVCARLRARSRIANAIHADVCPRCNVLLLLPSSSGQSRARSTRPFRGSHASSGQLTWKPSVILKAHEARATTDWKGATFQPLLDPTPAQLATIRHLLQAGAPHPPLLLASWPPTDMEATKLEEDYPDSFPPLQGCLPGPRATAKKGRPRTAKLTL